MYNLSHFTKKQRQRRKKETFRPSSSKLKNYTFRKDDSFVVFFGLKIKNISREWDLYANTSFLTEEPVKRFNLTWRERGKSFKLDRWRNCFGTAWTGRMWSFKCSVESFDLMTCLSRIGWSIQVERKSCVWQLRSRLQKLVLKLLRLKNSQPYINCNEAYPGSVKIDIKFFDNSWKTSPQPQFSYHRSLSAEVNTNSVLFSSPYEVFLIQMKVFVGWKTTKKYLFSTYDWMYQKSPSGYSLNGTKPTWTERCFMILWKACGNYWIYHLNFFIFFFRNKRVEKDKRAEKLKRPQDNDWKKSKDSAEKKRKAKTPKKEDKLPLMIQIF